MDCCFRGKVFSEAHNFFSTSTERNASRKKKITEEVEEKQREDCEREEELQREQERIMIEELRRRRVDPYVVGDSQPTF